MDTYSEQLVKKNETSGDNMKKTTIIIGGVLIVAGLLFVTFTITPFALLAAAAAVYGIYWLVTGINVEYEYIVTNGSLDIDKIISKRKRVNLLSVDIKDFSELGKYDQQPFSGTTIYAVGGEEELVYAVFNSDQYGAARLIFSPNEKIMKCVKPHLNRKIKY